MGTSFSSPPPPRQHNMFPLKQVSLIALLVASAYSAPQLGLDLEAEAPADEFINPNPEYNYAYQVSDDTAQTYIAHQEGRKDNVVTGEYSYVDPYGALITVNYIADENGYREERKSQADFVQIRAIPVVQAAPVVQVAKPAPIVRKVVKPAPARKVVKAVEPIVKQVVKAET